MFNVMIVDDEKIIRDGISKLIKWDSLDCHLVGIEKNGLDALNRIQDKNKPMPDIVITDVKMPLKTGIELIEDVYAFNKDIVFIVLSGYDEFDYAKSAMSLGVKYYLLKPSSEKEISQALEKACKDVMENRRLQEITNIADVKLSKHEGYSQIVGQILDAIDEHLSNPNLSLKWIADNVLFMNEDYLSRIFKKEVGHKFSDYLLNKKISLAKKMLLSGNEKKIYEIFETLGFDVNSRYFSQVFKKYTGMTPSQYRKEYN